MSTRNISRKIYLLFTKQHGLHVQTDAVRYLETELKDDPDFVGTLDKILKSYRKWIEDKNAVIVDKVSIEQVFEGLKAEAMTNTRNAPFQKEHELQSSLQVMTIHEDKEFIDITQHFHVANCFEMPRLHYDYHRKAFLTSRPPSLLAGAGDKAQMFRDRMLLVKQRLLRHERFCPTSMHLDKASYIQITPIKAMTGRESQLFTIFGMLTQLEEGKIYLEDEDAHIELELSTVVFDTGLFTDGSFVIVSGVYGADQVFHAEEISFPPAEKRETTNMLFPHVDFTGLPKVMVDEEALLTEERKNDNIFFVTISDVFLDQPKVVNGLRRIFEKYENEGIPLAFILLGNFSSRTQAYCGQEATHYKENFNALADMISEFPTICENSNFVLVPGSRDPWGGNLLPQPPIPEIFTSRLRQKVKKLTMTTNPCRIRYCTQDIVIFREDILNRLWRNVLLNPNVESEPVPAKHLIRTLIDQGHLCPVPLHIRPIYWSHDHALRLYPLPQSLILADHCESFAINYEETHCLNPGSFGNSDFSFAIYYPGRQTSERCLASVF